MVALASDGIYITVILISCQSSAENTREIVQDKSCGFAEVVVGSLKRGGGEAKKKNLTFSSLHFIVVARRARNCLPFCHGQNLTRLLVL